MPTPPAHTPNDRRGAQAHAEGGRTAVSRAVALVLTGMFVVATASVSLTQLWLEPQVWHVGSGGTGVVGHAPPADTLVAQVVTRNRRLLEIIATVTDQVDNESLQARHLRPVVQLLITRLAGAGSERVYVGRDGWLFFANDVQHVVGAGFLDEAQLARRAASGNTLTAAPQPDPRPALLAFNDALAERGITLVLMPTPVAVLEGARLLSEGLNNTPGLGALVVIDVGGATTDVHSVASGEPTAEGVIPHGLPEPHLKRTVEGDLGMRINAPAIAEAVGMDTLAEATGLDVDGARKILDEITAAVDSLPESTEQKRFAQALAAAAVGIAVARPAGTVSIVQTVTGPVSMQTGKDLGAVATVSGTGGVLAHGADPAAALARALADPAKPQSLRPKDPELRLDGDYLLFACGLLAGGEPEAALTLGLTHMHPVEGS